MPSWRGWPVRGIAFVDIFDISLEAPRIVACGGRWPASQRDHRRWVDRIAPVVERLGR
jgi:hypothetical protein